MKTYVTARDVLNRACSFHQGLAGFYEQLTRESERERLRLLVDFLSRHEQRFARCLEQYEEQAQEHLLGTWLQYGPEEQRLELPALPEFASDMSIDDVQDIALQCDDALARFYADAAGLVKNDDLRALFLDLVKQHEVDKMTVRKSVEAAMRSI